MRSFRGAGASSRTRRSRTRPMRCSCVRRMRMRASVRSMSRRRAPRRASSRCSRTRRSRRRASARRSLHPPLVGRNGAKLIVPFRPALAAERVMHGGQPVALVVAESVALAQDAAEQVVVEYEEMDSVAEVRAAIAADAPQLFSGSARQCRDRLDQSFGRRHECARSRSDLLRCGACRALYRGEPASRRRLDGAARRDRLVRRRRTITTRCAPARRARARSATSSSP